MTPSISNLRRAPGFTLTECLIASVVLAASVVGIGGTLGASYKNSQRLDESAIATTLARQMMEEMISRPYANGPGSSDSLLDYRLRNWGTADAIVMGDGTRVEMRNGGGYGRSSDVKYFDSVDRIDVGQSASLNPLPPVAVATVTVSTPSGAVVQLSQVIAER